ncbi:unnamed protein product [Paramecium primaurelia]|uniref:Uncharacterized protein n=1 Tax=Paramecium primaurelia TaxID=5886 RepID=A0A8S1M2W9_PARPR|nr:unnamed protein product [Paramecium primaurelia]
MAEFKEDKFFNKPGDSDDSVNKLKKKISKPKQQNQISTSQKIKEMFKKQQFKDIVNWAEKDTTITLHEYDEIKVNSQMLKLGQYALIKNAKNPSEDYVGKIQRIITIKENKSTKLICLCEVNWFYRKSEIIKFKPQAKPWISNNEVFSTNCTDYILASTILSPCRIVTLEEYETSSQVDKGVFFTRLEWLPTKKKFDGLSKLQNHCTCKQPQNPDQIYIQCDKCQKWYHITCVGLKKGEYEQKEYICGCCR